MRKRAYYLYMLCSHLCWSTTVGLNKTKINKKKEKRKWNKEMSVSYTSSMFMLLAVARTVE